MQALPLYVFVGVLLQRLTVADALFATLARLFRWTGAGTSVASSSSLLARLLAPRRGHGSCQRLQHHWRGGAASLVSSKRVRSFVSDRVNAASAFLRSVMSRQTQ